MSDLVSALPPLAAAFGPAGAVLLVLTLTLLCLYVAREREIRRGQRQAHERRDKQEERMIGVVERNATASERLSQSIDHQGTLLRDGLERQAHDLAEIIREIRR